MAQTLSDQLICHEDDLARYSPPGHGGTAQVNLDDEDPVICGPGTMVKFPPKVAHHMLSMEPEVLELMIIYSPPLPKCDDTPLE